MSVKEAAKFLDKKHPGWENKIGVEILNMSSPQNCILGQLYGDYVSGKKILGITSDNDLLIDGFCSGALNWKAEIELRKNKKGLTFAECIPLLLAGKKVAREKDSYLQISNNVLYFFHKNDYTSALLLKKDIESDKWFVVPEFQFKDIKEGERFKVGNKICVKINGFSTNVNAISVEDNKCMSFGDNVAVDKV